MHYPAMLCIIICLLQTYISTCIIIATASNTAHLSTTPQTFHLAIIIPKIPQQSQSNNNSNKMIVLGQHKSSQVSEQGLL